MIQARKGASELGGSWEPWQNSHSAVTRRSRCWPPGQGLTPLITNHSSI